MSPHLLQNPEGTARTECLALADPSTLNVLHGERIARIFGRFSPSPWTRRKARLGRHGIKLASAVPQDHDARGLACELCDRKFVSAVERAGIQFVRACGFPVSPHWR